MSLHQTMRIVNVQILEFLPNLAQYLVQEVLEHYRTVPILGHLMLPL